MPIFNTPTTRTFGQSSADHTLLDTQGSSRPLRPARSTPSFVKTLQLILAGTVLPAVAAQRSASMRAPIAPACHLPDIITATISAPFDLSMEQTWFQDQHNQCGVFELRSKETKTPNAPMIRLASNHTGIGCERLQELLTMAYQLPGCAELHSTSEHSHPAPKNLVANVHKQERLSMVFDTPLTECAFSIAKTQYYCDQHIQSTQNDADAFQQQHTLDATRENKVMVLTCSIGLILVLTAKGIVAAELASGEFPILNYHRPESYRPNDITFIVNLLHAATASAAPLFQSRVGVALGQDLYNTLLGQNTLMEKMDSKTLDLGVTRGGAFMATIHFGFLLAYAIRAKESNNPGPESQQAYLKQTHLARLVAGELLRTLAPLLGALTLPKGQHVVNQMFIAVIYSEFVNFALRPLTGAALDVTHEALDIATTNPRREHQARAVQPQHRFTTQRHAYHHLLAREDATGQVPCAQRLAHKIERLKEKLGLTGRDIEDILPRHLRSLYVCPISMDIMSDPVVLPARGSQYTFEREHLHHWLTHTQRHPLATQERVPANTVLYRFHSLQASIEEWVETQL